MFYGEAIDDLLDRLKIQNTTDETIRATIGRKINQSYKSIANNSMTNWKCLIKNGNLRTIKNYTTGTVSIVKYDETNRETASTVTGSGTVWTSKMVGRYFKHQNCDHWYRIIRVTSATTLILDHPIIEDSASGLTYDIWNRFYYFPSNVERVLDFGRWTGNGIIEESSLSFLRDRTRNISNTGVMSEFVMGGLEEFSSPYSTGTVTLNEDSNVMIGSGTSWMDNVEAGDLVTVGTNRYHVKRVESDTRIILFNYAITTVSNFSYSIEPYDRVGAQLFYNPDNNYILPYVFIERVFDLVNEDYDRFELTDKFDLVILEGAEAQKLKDSDDSKYASAFNLFSSRLTDLRRTDSFSRPKKQVFRPEIKGRRGGYA